jgi:hypothetical protein
MLEQERSALHPLPEEAFEIAWWGSYLVRKDIHIRVGHNDYSVPYPWSGRRVLVRLSEQSVRIYAPAEEAEEPSLLAEHPRLLDRGGVQTEPSHYPPQKRMATQEIHRRRVMTVREAGPDAAAFLSNLGADRWLQAEQLAQLARLVQQHGQEPVNRACRRARHFGATGAATIERILAQRLQDEPLGKPATPRPAKETAPRADFGRALSEYGKLLPEKELN